MDIFLAFILFFGCGLELLFDHWWSKDIATVLVYDEMKQQAASTNNLGNRLCIHIQA